MKITIKQTGYYDVSWFGTEGSGSKTQFLEEGEEVEVDAERAAVTRIGGASLTVKWSEQQGPITDAEMFAERVEKLRWEDAVPLIRARDAALVARCAELLEKHGHNHAANLLHKMAREGKIL